jgi:acyl carrier protein
VLAIVIYHCPATNRPSDPQAVIADSTQLVADLGYDSLAMAEIVFFFEDLYKVAISNDDLLKIQSVGDLRAYVRTKVQATSAASASPAAPAAPAA